MHSCDELKLSFAAAGVATAHRHIDGSVQILFDSFLQPAFSGMRSAPMSIREIVCRSEPYQIDLLVEAQIERHRLVVTGQLMDISHAEIVSPNIKVTLSNLQGRVVETTTNQFGEFSVELEDSGDLEISFFGPGGKPVVILLRGAVKQSSATKH